MYFIILLFDATALGYGIGLLLGNAAALAVLAAGAALFMYPLFSIYYIIKNNMEAYWPRSSLTILALTLLGVALLSSGTIRIIDAFLHVAVEPKAGGGALFTILGALIIGYSVYCARRACREGC